jgi:hypothetical protein
MSELKYIMRSEAALLTGPQGVPGGSMTWRGVYASGTAYSADDAVVSSEGRAFYALQSTTGHAPPSWPDTENAYWRLFAEKGDNGSDGSDGSKAYWDDVPGTPARVSDTSFNIVDPGNANLYDKMFSSNTIISWIKSGTWWQFAKVIYASYASDVVTVYIIGQPLTADFSDMKFCVHRAMIDQWIVPGMMPSSAQTAIGKQIIWAEDRYVFSAKVLYGSAPATTGGVWDINDDGSTLFATTKPSIAAGNTVGPEVASITEVASGSRVTLDYDSGHATTPGSDAYIFIWSMPVAWRYLP